MGLTNRWLEEIKPLKLIPDDQEGLGAGRVGRLAGDGQACPTFVDSVKSAFNKQTIKVVGEQDRVVKKVAVACGSGGSFLSESIFRGCDTFVTGEATFHSCLEAQAADMNLVLIGHYDSERFAVEDLAERLAGQFGKMEIWASEKESDPIQWW